LPNRFELEHPRATPDDIETSKDWARCIAYGIVGAYGDDIAGLGSVVRSWKDLTAGWQWAERKPKIDPEVVITISNVSSGSSISTFLSYYTQSLIEYSL
jgi:hypothetical protein